ncbi:MAG: hypothetical protein ACOZNI_00970 [Myxococcota bacterium]
MSTLEDAKSVGLPYRAEPAKPLEMSDLEEFHARHAHDTWWARVALLTLIFGMLGVNLWMTKRSYDALMADVDASRMAMSELHEQTTTRLDALEARLVAIEGRLAAQQPVAAAP